MAETRRISEEYTNIGHKVMKNTEGLSYLLGTDVMILFLASDKEKKSKGRTVYGECEKVPDKYKWAIPADFTITVYEPNCYGMSDDQLETLMWHELLHVGYDDSGEGEPKLSIVPHDIEDFEAVLTAKGLHWAQVAEK